MLKIAICDDNQNEAAKIQGMLAEYQKLRTHIEISVDVFERAGDLLAALSGGARYRLYLLDILMPEMDGIELSRLLRRSGHSDCIIFLTSSREFAYEAYGVRAMDYLLKPVQRQKLFAALDNAAEALGMAKNAFALIQMADADRMVNMGDIVAVEVQGHTLCYYLSGGEQLKSKVLRVPFGAVTEALTQDGRFIRPHRSFLINASHVSSITKKSFMMDNGMEIPISRLRFSEVKEEYMNYLTGQGAKGWGAEHAAR